MWGGRGWTGTSVNETREGKEFELRDSENPCG